MSARDKLVNSLIYNRWPNREMFEEWIDDFAHELAEKIRATDNGDYYASGPTQNAADLIDPEAS